MKALSSSFIHLLRISITNWTHRYARGQTWACEQVSAGNREKLTTCLLPKCTSVCIHCLVHRLIFVCFSLYFVWSNLLSDYMLRSLVVPSSSEWFERQRDLKLISKASMIAICFASDSIIECKSGKMHTHVRRKRSRHSDQEWRRLIFDSG